MKRNTFQKQGILAVLRLLRGKHPTADRVYEHAKKIIPSIGRATGYRILDEYVNEGIIVRLYVPGLPFHYDDVLEPHNHLLCCCNRLVDLPAMHFDNHLLMSKNDVGGCRITGVEVIFRGICPACVADGV